MKDSLNLRDQNLGP